MSKLSYERPFIQKLNTGSMNKFGTKTEFAPVTHLDGIRVSKLIEDYGSPCFVISERQIRKNVQNANKAFKQCYDIFTKNIKPFIGWNHIRVINKKEWAFCGFFAIKSWMRSKVFDYKLDFLFSGSWTFSNYWFNLKTNL